MILGIDFGQANIGLALSEGAIATPFSVVHHPEEIREVVRKQGITKIVVGLSEGKSREEALAFGKKLTIMLRLPVEYIDETLSTYEAGPKAHAKAAAIILQRFLDDTNV